jgi:hypothetical protein
MQWEHCEWWIGNVRKELTMALFIKLPRYSAEWTERNCENPSEDGRTLSKNRTWYFRELMSRVIIWYRPWTCSLLLSIQMWSDVASFKQLAMWRWNYVEVRLWYGMLCVEARHSMWEGCVHWVELLLSPTARVTYGLHPWVDYYIREEHLAADPPIRTILNGN